MNAAGVGTAARDKATVMLTFGSLRFVSCDEKVHLAARANGDALGTDSQAHRLVIVQKRNGQLALMGSQDKQFACLVCRHQNRSIQVGEDLGKAWRVFKSDFAQLRLGALFIGR